MKKRKTALFLILLISFVLSVCIGAIQAVTEENFGIFDLMKDFSVYQKTEELPDMEQYYYYSSLEGNEKKAYIRIYESLWKEAKTIRIYGIDEENMDAIVNMVLSDHPELFYYGNYYEYICYYDLYTILLPKYTYSGEVRKEKEEEIHKAVEKALEQIDKSGSDYEQVKDVYEYVIRTVDYVEDAPDNQNMYSALVGKKTVCAGYATASQYLLQQLGMEVLYVTGDADGEPHAWNIVNVDGGYYHVDATYGDRLAEDPDAEKDNPKEYLYDYNYLCCDDEELEKERKIDQLGEIPVCDSEELEYFRLNGRHYDSYSEEIWNDIKKEIGNGEDYWECKFENAKDYNKMLKEVEDGERYFELVIDYLERTRGYYNVMTWYSYDDTSYTISCWYENR